MSNHADLVAAFLAKNSVTKVETGARSMTDRQVYCAMGYEAETVIVYEAHLIGEDGKEFCVEVKGKNKGEANLNISKQYPCAMIEEICHKGERAERQYESLGY